MKTYQFLISCPDCFLDGSRVSCKALDRQSAETCIREILAKSKTPLPAIDLTLI